MQLVKQDQVVVANLPHLDLNPAALEVRHQILLPQDLPAAQAVPVHSQDLLLLLVGINQVVFPAHHLAIKVQMTLVVQVEVITQQTITTTAVPLIVQNVQYCLYQYLSPLAWVHIGDIMEHHYSVRQTFQYSIYWEEYLSL